MPIITTESQAFEHLQRLIQDTIDPTVSSGELEQILDANKRGSVWTTATAYAVGDVVVPSVLNGHRYICTTGGTSATEPTWSTSREGTASDGLMVWEEAGVEYDLWDMRQAAYDGWMLKASKAICKVDFKQGDTSFTNSQVFAFCQKMADRYRSVRVA